MILLCNIAMIVVGNGGDILSVYRQIADKMQHFIQEISIYTHS